jgi:hypothetical protein
MWLKRAKLGLVCLVGLGLMGCGPKLTPVQGRILYRGQPLAGARVSFLSQPSRTATGTTESSGQFTLLTGARPGVEAGTYQVIVTKFRQLQSAREISRADVKKMKMYQGGRLPAPVKSEIPEQYGDPHRSGLAAVVTGDPSQDVFEFRLND